jgi:hypothetical protein
VGWFPPLREGNLKEGGKYELWLHDWYKTRPSPTVWERGGYMLTLSECRSTSFSVRRKLRFRTP